MIYSQHKMTDYNVPPTADALPLADVLREHIREDRLARLTVTGNSMAPLLKSPAHSIRGDLLEFAQRNGVPV